MTHKIGRGNALTLSYALAFEEEIDGMSPLSGQQTVRARMYQHELEVRWPWLFD